MSVDFSKEMVQMILINIVFLSSKFNIIYTYGYDYYGKIKLLLNRVKQKQPLMFR